MSKLKCTSYPLDDILIVSSPEDTLCFHGDNLIATCPNIKLEYKFVFEADTLSSAKIKHNILGLKEHSKILIDIIYDDDISETVKENCKTVLFEMLNKNVRRNEILQNLTFLFIGFWIGFYLSILMTL